MRTPQGPKVLLAMSGGVDSSVAAALLLRQGYEVVGCFMRHGVDPTGEEASGASEEHRALDSPAALGSPALAHKQGCCSVNDACDARLVAAKLGIPLYVLNFQRDFSRIVTYFEREYHAGRTPNPCVRCNDWLKFGRLFDYAATLGARYVATGHYARVTRTGDRTQLLRGVDPRKDQSYVLFGTKPDRLSRMLLPVGAYEKPAIRDLARELDLPVFDKPDSQEICFVPDQDYAGLLRRRSPERFSRGALLNEQGEVLGEHEGQQQFTIGQRRGLGVARGVPLYVVNKDAAANTVTLGPKESLLVTGCIASQTNWLTDPPTTPRRCQIKVRYNSPPTPGRVCLTGADTMEVSFAQPISAVTPGQAVVCYDGDEVLGGGWIDKATH